MAASPLAATVVTATLRCDFCAAKLSVLDEVGKRKTIQRPLEGSFGREVLHGVGADGVGVKFTIFAVNRSCFPLSFERIREKAKKNEKQKKGKTKKNEKAKKQKK